MKKLTTFLIGFLCCIPFLGFTSNLSNLLSSSEWNNMFPNRAGAKINQVQGYTVDFFSYQNLETAISEMSDFRVSIIKKPGVGGQKVTVTKKSTGFTYIVSSADSWWEGQDVPEETVLVDFADFISRVNSINNKRELSAFLGNISWETNGGWEPAGSGKFGDRGEWGLHYVHELNTNSSYASSSVKYPAVSGKKYYGRGPIQLTGNINYGQFSEFLYNDKSILLNNPNKIQEEGILAFKSAIWFWMMPQCPKPSCHQVMHDLWISETGDYANNSRMYSKGFAHTNNIINGGLECRSGASSTFKVVIRASLYLYYLSYFEFTESEIAGENQNGYSTYCYESGVQMTSYADCNVEDSGNSACSFPNLGSDQVICSSLELNSGITLKDGESIKWYKDGSSIPIIGASSSNYLALGSGVYKVEVTGLDCSSSDEINLTDGDGLQVSVDNEGVFCSTTGPSDIKITLNGGQGFYELFEDEEGGAAIKTGTSFLIGSDDVSFAQSKTFYVGEPVGESIILGDDSRRLDDSEWSDYSANLSWNDNRVAFTTLGDNINLKSVDLAVGYIGDAVNHTINIYIYTYGTNSLVASKSFVLEDFGDIVYNGDLNTFDLNFSLPAGQYELSLMESNALIWTTNLLWGNDYGYSTYVSSGLASIDGVTQPSSDSSYPRTFNNVHVGVYNWNFSSGGNSSICGRSPVTVYHDCSTGKNDLSSRNVIVFPNPANDFLSISFNGVVIEDGTIDIFNKVGQVILSKVLNGSSNVTQIQIAGLEDGVYFMKLSSLNGTYNTKFLIAK